MMNKEDDGKKKGVEDKEGVLLKSETAVRIKKGDGVIKEGQKN